MVDYTRLQATANRLIEKNGRSITFIKFNETADDADKPWNGPATGGQTELVLNGVFVPPNTVRQFGLTALGEGTDYDDLIAKSEQIAIVAQGDVDLREYSELKDDDDTQWGIIGLQVLRPGTTRLLSFVGVKR